MKAIRSSRKGQQGLTLIELIIVVVILGILAAVIMRSTSGSPDPANATAMRSTAKELATAVGYVHANLGTGLSATANPLPNGTNTMLDVLLVGRSTVKATYQTQYDRLNMRPLETDFRVRTRPTATTTGSYELLTYPVLFVSCPVGKVCVQFSNVPSDTLAELAAKFGITSFVPGTALTTASSPLRYTAANANNQHVVTIEQTP